MSEINYGDYLQISKIIGAQKPQSKVVGREAHDEMLFIVVHQVYELWFKQILFEVDSVLKIFGQTSVPEWNIGISVGRLSRVIEILKLFNSHIKILETMTPLDFLDFRDLINPASGFQSLQFRLLEIKLGLEIPQRLQYQNQPYYTRLTETDQTLVKVAEEQSSLIKLLDKWLSRIPFIETADFAFMKQYQMSVNEMLLRDEETIGKNQQMSPESKSKEIEKVRQVKAFSELIFVQKSYDQLVAEGKKRLSYKAMSAALFINVYRDIPVLHLPFKLLTAAMDIDELLTSWRYQHALMVQRMIGNKIGTGGSSGYDYLRMTVEKHKIFTDLFDLSTLYIPRSQLPKLPDSLIAKMGFAS